MIDTTPFVRHYFEDPKDHVYDWRGITPRNAYLVHLLKVLIRLDYTMIYYRSVLRKR